MTKRLSIITILCLIATWAISQERKLEIYRQGNVVYSTIVGNIDSLKFSKVLLAPSSVSVNMKETGVELTWAAVPGANYYEVYRGSSSGNTYVLVSGQISGTTYTDTFPLTGMNYYKIKAVGDNIESDLSATPAVADWRPVNASGLYMGIIGFNQELTIKEISRLTTSTKKDFTTFVSGMTSKDGTLLYYAVDNAIDKLQSTSLPEDVVNVAIITFTDGLDQGSLLMNSNYLLDSEYLSAVNDRIKNEKIKGKSISAYSIGLKGKDVEQAGEELFQANLQNLASSPENATEVSTMEEVNAKFQEIADQLYNVSASQSVSLTIPGQSNGDRIRFTFDDITSADKSALYIEGVFSLSDRSLRDVVFSGMTIGGDTIKSVVSGAQEGIFVTFTFEDLRQETGELLDTTNIRQWEYIASTSYWQKNSEFKPSNNTEITIDRKSAAIMLVLDCSSSLGAEFASIQAHANAFIEKMSASTELDLDDATTGNTSSTDTEITVKGVTFKMVAVEGGTFLMGAQSSDSSSDNYDSDAYSDESPTHSVTLSDYYIGETEVTQALWEAVMTYSGTTTTGETLTAYSDPWLGDINPSASYGVGDNYPAYYVSHDDIVDIFLPRLNAITGKTFRLPTEAEWEYAARGGNKSKGYKYAGSNTISDVAWYTRNSGSTTHPVGGKQANELGLYDMSGNVYEWCSDWYDSNYYSSSPTTNPTGPATGSYRVLRGCGWGSEASYCRVSVRRDYAPGRRIINYGFRLSRSE